MKISILSSSLANNCFGRAYILAKALARRYEVEIIGPTFGKEIWRPCQTGEFSIRALRERTPMDFVRSIRPILRKIDGDVVYAVKPLMASFGIALAKRREASTPIVLDIDDWQPGFTTEAKGQFDINRVRSRISGFRTSPNSYYWVRLMERLIPYADDITTVSSFFQRRYGTRAVLVPHGRDASLFDPRRYDRNEIRIRLGLENKKIISFLGTPKPHKGIGDIVDAVRRLDRKDVRVLVIGVLDDDPFMQKLVFENGQFVIPIGMVSFQDVPKYLSASDLVVLPQKDESKTTGQIPAKLIDAMAMGKPIIATDVSDIASILDGCGIIVGSGQVSQISEQIDTLLVDHKLAEDLGHKARTKFLREFSLDAMEAQLLKVFEPYANSCMETKRSISVDRKSRLIH